MSAEQPELFGPRTSSPRPDREGSNSNAVKYKSTDSLNEALERRLTVIRKNKEQIIKDSRDSSSFSTTRTNQDHEKVWVPEGGAEGEGNKKCLPVALQHRAVWCISGCNPIRMWLYRFTSSKYFESFILILILSNCIVLAIDDPTRSEEEPWVTIAELAFTSAFTVELVLKVVARGFALHEGSYLRSDWNKLDFMLVLLTWLGFLPGVQNFSGIRVVRVLRPLRSINGIPGLRSIVSALFLSVKGLLHVLMLILFFFFVFGILGVQLFSGLYRRRCVDEFGNIPTGLEEQFCRDRSQTHGQLFGRSCPSNLSCRAYKNPDHGYSSFDNILFAFLLIFQCVTLEGWVVQFYRVQDLMGALVATVYFLPVVILGSFFILNLALAVISEKFHFAKELQSETELENAITRMLTSNMTNNSQNEAITSTPSEGNMDRLRMLFYMVTANPIFQWVILFFIFANTILLSIEHEGQPDDLTDCLAIANILLTAVFTAEMMVKLFAMGFRQYASDNFNILDGCVVIVSCVELVLSTDSNVSVFRALRLLRVFKVMKNFPSLRSLVQVILKAIADTGYLNTIILLYLFVAALVGMQLFGGKFNFENEPPPRATFDSFYWSLLTVFQILTRDSWMIPMWNAMRATHPAACLYFVSLVLLGDFIILNLFLAILINSFGNMGFEIDDGSEEGGPFITCTEWYQSEKDTKARYSTGLKDIVHLGGTSVSPPQEAWDGFIESASSQLGTAAVSLCIASSAQRNLPETNGGYSLLLFSPNNLCRIYITYLVTHPHFEKAVLVLITASSLVLILEDSTNSLNRPIQVLDIVFTGLFICEMLLKIIAFGLIRGNRAYLKDGWSVLDASVVVVSILALVFADFAVVRVFRALRALRPLRVVNRNIGLKIVVRALLLALPGVANVALVVFLCFLVFSILGVQLFSGKLGYCTDPSVFTKQDCIGFNEHLYNTTVDGSGLFVVQQRLWLSRPQNFDHVLNALLTLFEVSTLEMWSEIMYNTIDGTSPGKGPVRNNSPLVGLYFLLFVVIGSFFLLNLFVGVVIFNYNLEKRNVEGRALLSPVQERWIQLQRMMLTFSPFPRMPNPTLKDDGLIRSVLGMLVNHRYFEGFILSTICLNIIIMSADHYDEAELWVEISYFIDTSCSIIFILEAAAKLIAWQRTYFREPWNRFDFVLAFFALVSVVLQMVFSSDAAGTSAVKIVRIFRTIRLLRLSKGLRVLLETLWYSLPYLSNIFLFLGLIFFIFSTLGVSLFKGQRGEYLTYHTNFDNFLSALLVLFRTSTGEDWNGIMHDLMHDDTDCLSDCGPVPWIAPLYFISFLLVAAQVMLNLFIAIILDNFSMTVQIERSKISMKDLNNFVQCWSHFDMEASLIIPTMKLPNLLTRLGPPLGVRSCFTRVELLRQIKGFQIPEHGGIVHFVEVLIPLARKSFEIQLSPEEVVAQEEGWKDHFPCINNLPVVKHRKHRITVDQFFAASYIGAAYRRSKAREHVEQIRRRRAVVKAVWFANENSKTCQTPDVIKLLFPSSVPDEYLSTKLGDGAASHLASLVSQRSQASRISSLFD